MLKRFPVDPPVQHAAGAPLTCTLCWAKGCSPCTLCPGCWCKGSHCGQSATKFLVGLAGPGCDRTCSAARCRPQGRNSDPTCRSPRCSSPGGRAELYGKDATASCLAVLSPKEDVGHVTPTGAVKAQRPPLFWSIFYSACLMYNSGTYRTFHHPPNPRRDVGRRENWLLHFQR